MVPSLRRRCALVPLLLLCVAGSDAGGATLRPDALPDTTIRAVRELAERYLRALHDEDLATLGALFAEKVLDLRQHTTRGAPRSVVLRRYRDWFGGCPVSQIAVSDVFDDEKLGFHSPKEMVERFGMSFAGASSGDVIVMIPTSATIKRWLHQPPALRDSDVNSPIARLSQCVFSDFSALLVRPVSAQWKIVGVFGSFSSA